MNFEGLIQTHLLFCEVKKYLQEECMHNIGEEKFNSYFEPYENLKIKPTNVYLRLTAHKKAVFTLGKCITDLMESESIKNIKLPNVNKEIGSRIFTGKEYAATFTG